jgi:hypothetical protein
MIVNREKEGKSEKENRTGIGLQRAEPRHEMYPTVTGEAEKYNM